MTDSTGTLARSVDRRSRRERFATSAVFVAFGMVLGTWAAHLPLVKDTLGASASSMGTLLVVLGVGALVGMQLSGRAVDALGSGRVAVAGGVAMSLALVPPLVSSTWWPVTIGALTLGLAIGVSEVGMNASAVRVEQDYGRPIMASFHGMFSVGTVAGAALSAAAFALGVGVRTTAVLVAVLALTLCGAAASVLARRPPSSQSTVHDAEPQAPDAVATTPRRRIAVYGVMAFLLLLTEGVAMDWSSLHAQQHLGGSAGAGAAALASFVAAMTVGRFTVDRVAARVGPVAVVRWGGLLCSVGLVAVMASPLLPLTCLGWLLLGLGLSGCVPQVFTATGNTPGASARALSRVVGAGYLAVLAGPAIIGWVADAVTLNNAMVIPIVAVLVCVCAAGTLRVPGR
ncbi:MAG: MFS transporter [Mycobacterium kyogaense]|uniref:MFS transporter n=1 Tax=Mycobacterium kyogaense TaxID=2212479 RepID=UPI002FF61D0A